METSFLEFRGNTETPIDRTVRGSEGEEGNPCQAGESGPNPIKGGSHSGAHILQGAPRTLGFSGLTRPHLPHGSEGSGGRK